MSKSNIKKWNAIQIELDALYKEFDKNTKMTVEEYQKKEEPLRIRQSLLRDK